VTLLDVLEHIDDHAGTLKAIEKMLKPGGKGDLSPCLHSAFSGAGMMSAITISAATVSTN